ncbi:MAG: hypothetical protein ACXIUV_10910 [Alkalilacustris sp.]
MQPQGQPTASRRPQDDLAALRAEVRALHAILPGLAKPVRADTHKGG